MRNPFYVVATTLFALLFVACGSGDGASTPSADGATPPNLDSIPFEPLPEELPPAFLIRGDESAVEEEAAEEIIYVVEPGDSLAVIAEAFGVTAEELQRLNGIADPGLLRAGDELRIPVRPGTESERIAATLDEDGEDFSGPPPGEEYTVQPGDSLIAIGIQFGFEWFEIANYNRLSDFEANNLIVGETLIIPPDDGEEEEDAPAEPPG